MRLLLFSLILFYQTAFAQLDVGNGGADPCTVADIPVAGGTLECTSLSLASLPVFNATAAPLVIKVTGAVSITGALSVSGINAGPALTSASGFQVFGGQGGPGAGDGGGEDGILGLFPGLETDATTQISDTPGGGFAATGGTACGDGGGGAGFRTVGFVGASCSGNGPGGPGGTVTAASLFSGVFRGGFGGGAGAEAPDLGGGGGGGGAIRIIAGGNISISGSIAANGGNGGDGGLNGGGGGAGSGGVIWLQSLGNINITGSLSVIPGTGGTATGGGVGGNGGFGFIRLEDADGIITGGGSFPSAEKISLNLGNSVNLKSDISCGAVKSSDDNSHTLFQLIAGFFLAIGLIALINKLKFLTQSKTQS